MPLLSVLPAFSVQEDCKRGTAARPGGLEEKAKAARRARSRGLGERYVASPPLASGVTANDFLKALWGDTRGIAELTAISKDGVRSWPFTYPDSLDSIVPAARRHNEHANVYMGVCLRRETWPRKNRRGGTDLRGTEENALSSGAVWAEFDFADQGHKGKTIPAEAARQALQEFPRKPSIIIRSGGGIQVYWLLKELALEKELQKVKAVNKALAKFFGSDPQSTDLARILRIPWTRNIKYTPPRPVEISWWRPELKYVLDDFDFLPLEKEISIPNEEPTSASEGPNPHSTKQPRQAPQIKLEDDTCILIGKHFGNIWFEGWRHEMALCVAGWLAHSEVSLESAKGIVAAASNIAQGDTQKRLKDVEDTYRKYSAGEEVKGYPSLVAMIDEGFPPGSRKDAVKTLTEIGKLLPKKKRGDDEEKIGCKPDFEILKVIKFDSRPARYVVTIRKTGQEKEWEIPCEIETFTNITKFRTAFTEVTPNSQTLAPIKQWRWEYMFSRAPHEVRAAPQEATSSGSIKAKLEAFLDEKKENPELGDLKTFPGYNEKEIFFQFETFRKRVRDAGIKATDREISHVLRDDDWEDTRKWVGSKNPRLWVKAIIQGGSGNGNGNGNGNGHGPTPPPPPPPEAKELFDLPPETPPEREPGGDLENSPFVDEEDH